MSSPERWLELRLLDPARLKEGKRVWSYWVGGKANYGKVTKKSGKKDCSLCRFKLLPSSLIGVVQSRLLAGAGERGFSTKGNILSKRKTFALFSVLLLSLLTLSGS